MQALSEHELLPVEHLVYQSPVVRIGAFRCSSDHQLFPDSGPIRHHAIVFPRSTVRIQHEGDEPFVSAPGFANLYNQAERYRRFRVHDPVDDCDWYHFDSEQLSEILGSETATDESAPLFKKRQVPVSSHVQILHRQLFNYVALVERPNSLLVVESAIAIAAGVLRQRLAQPPLKPSDLHLADRAKEAITAMGSEPVALERLSRVLGCSVGHLCRTFRRVTGTTLYAFQLQLRLTKALDQLERSCDDLVTLAFDLGFSSHSHFTAVFRRRFGLTPSEFRRGLASLSPRRRMKIGIESVLEELVRSEH